MQDLNKKLKVLADLISKEFDTHDFRSLDGKNGKYEKSRYLYVYLAHTYLDINFTAIRDSMPIYNYPKTVYQVFKRMWERRKESELKTEIAFIAKQFKEFELFYHTEMKRVDDIIDKVLAEIRKDEVKIDWESAKKRF